MLSFLLRRVLKKSLTISLSWGLVYPTLFGGVVVRQAELKSKDAASIVSVSRTEIHPLWRSLLDDVIQVERAELSGISARVMLDDPLRIVYCLQDSTCKSPQERASQRARFGGAAPTPIANKSPDSEAPRKPLQLEVDSVSFEEGELILRRGERETVFRIVRGSGNHIALPLDNRSGSLELDLLVEDEGELGSQAIPLRAKLKWAIKEVGAPEGSLRLELYTSKLPLSVLSSLFPKAVPGSGVLGGTISGSVLFEYRPGAGWKLLEKAS